MRPKRLAIFEACAIGLVSALAAVLLKQGSGWLGGWRIAAAHTLPTWLVLPSIGLLGGCLTGWLIQRLAPEASGSGIPQVKAALAYVPIALNLRVALVKLASTMLSLGAGLTLGRQGPTVQVGAALAAQFSRWVPTSPDYQRQLLAAGAAAGLAAGFNAPIAGVIFVVEELLQDVSNLTLGTAILASFVGGVVSRLLGGHGLNMSLSASNAKFSLAEIPLFLLLGVLAGLLGALFCKGIFVSLALNRKLPRTGGLAMRIGLAGLLSGLVLAFLPASLRDNTGLQEFLVTGGAGWQITALAFVSKFLLTLLAYGSGAPGGLFAPSLILGSALGYLVSLCAEAVQVALGVPPDLAIAIGSPTTYALTGMGAFFSAVTRGPITAIVIVFEMTTDFNLVLPLMMGSVVAYLVAEAIASGSIYKKLL
ncbi:MAG TPA: ClC family H(+)/Cl(-) exchange transporter, partial [Candidatus Obscuribacterales bacterium]